MKTLDMIAEWRKGCSDATAEHPEECHQCTRSLIDALERRLAAVEFDAMPDDTEWEENHPIFKLAAENDELRDTVRRLTTVRFEKAIDFSACTLKVEISDLKLVKE